MKWKLAAITGTLLACCVLFAASKQEAEIKEIKRMHKHNSDLLIGGIRAGYLACRLGLPLSNYVAEVEAAHAKLLSEKIAEAQKETP